LPILSENVERCNFCAPPTGERVQLPPTRWHLKTQKPTPNAATEPMQPQKFAEQSRNLIRGKIITNFGEN